MAIEFECNLEQEYEHNDVDIWGAAFLWNGKKSVEYNFCIDENGENCSAIYKMTEDISGQMHTHYGSFVHYEVKFDDGWKEKLKATMEDALKKLFPDDIQDNEESMLIK